MFIIMSEAENENVGLKSGSKGPTHSSHLLINQHACSLMFLSKAFFVMF